MRNLIDKIEENANIDKSFKKEVYRKAIHLSSLWIPALIYFTQPAFSIFLFSLLFCGDALLEYGNYKNIPGQDKHSGSCFLRRCATRNAAASFFRSAVPYMFCWLRLSAPSSSANRLRLYPSPLCWCPTQWPLWWEKPLARVCFINTNRLKAPSHFYERPPHQYAFRAAVSVHLCGGYCLYGGNFGRAL